MRKLKNDLTGRKFGKLTVIGPHDCGERNIMYACQCDCGGIKTVRADSLLKGACKSCGCLKREQDKINLSRKTHGLSGSRLYNIWAGMKDRCLNKSNARYSDYGGRGITVCEEWSKSFDIFYKWSIENGYKEELSIDRIDNDAGYEPKNCRWITNKEQCNNRRSNINITIGNTTKTLMQWCEIFNLDYKKIYARHERNGFESLDRLFCEEVV